VNHDCCIIKAETVRDDGRDIDDNNNPCLSVDYVNDFGDLFWQDFISLIY